MVDLLLEGLEFGLKVPVGFTKIVELLSQMVAFAAKGIVLVVEGGGARPAFSTGAQRHADDRQDEYPPPPAPAADGWLIG